MDRRSYIGGSNAAPIMGHGYCTALQLLRYKRGELKKPPILLRDIHRGNTMEPIVEKMIRDEHASELNSPEMFEKYDAFPDQKMEGREGEKQIFVRDEDMPFVGGHPDGIEPGVLWEIKCPRMTKVGRIENSEVEYPTMKSIIKSGLPMYWLLQVQHYMMVTGLPTSKIAVFDYDHWDLLIFDVPASREIQDELRRRYEFFWKCVETGTEFTLASYNVQRDVDETLLKNAVIEFEEGRSKYYEGNTERKQAKSKIVSMIGGEGEYTGEDFYVRVNRVDKKTYHYYQVKSEIAESKDSVK